MEVRWQRQGSAGGWALRMMSIITVALAVFCVVLAVAWSREREAKACWREAAELDLEANGCVR